MKRKTLEKLLRKAVDILRHGGDHDIMDKWRGYQTHFAMK